ncbi:MobH family relaxase [Salinicola endophyticus]|uniref:MobH family relaxase n=1 Tax=Salinicola endophyticus TaxID=1949083 RepID=UPI000DA1F3C3|nr:MobH family relaxase [Salinicola endophyticus]
MLLERLRWWGRARSVKGQGEGLEYPRSGPELLALPRRQQMLKMLWDTTSLTQEAFDDYILAPIQRYAELVQQLPASESHHHSYAGGMLDHALEMACYGLKLRQRHLLPPGGKPEDQSSSGELWSAAIIYAALMHDVAKTLVDIEIHLEDGRNWKLWHGPIPGPYRVRYRAGRDYHLHAALNPILCQQVLGPHVLDWLLSQPRLFGLLTYTISGHTDRGGIIAEIVHQADRASVSKAMGGDPLQALAAPVESLQRKLADGLRYMVKEQFQLNQRGGVAWLTKEALWLVSPRAINELKAHLYAQGVKSIPADLGRLYGELQAHGLIEEVSEGKSVWKCEVSEGDWSQSLSMIRISPTLIWGTGTKPEPFKGKIETKGCDTLGSESNADAASVSNDEVAANEVGADENTPLPAKNKDSSDAGGSDGKAGVDLESALDDELISLFENKVEVGDESNSETFDVQDNKDEPDAPGEVGEAKGMGERFWGWLQQGLESRSIIVNDSNAVVHTVSGTYFLVSPGIFKRFASAELGGTRRWKEVQSGFQKLGHHVKTHGVNIQKVVVAGPNKTTYLMGYLLKSPRELTQAVPPDNWVLTLEKEEGRVGDV